MTIIRIRNGKPRQPIEIDQTVPSSADANHSKRMDRIAENYERLDSMLSELELKIRSDERLKAIDESLKESELVERSSLSRYRPKKKTAARNVAPRKPR